MLRRALVLAISTALACSAPAQPAIDAPGLVMPTMTVTAKAPPVESATPEVAVPPSVPATRIALTDGGACAVLSDGGVSCWGARWGITPHRLLGVKDAADVSVGEDLAVVHADGSVSVFVDGETKSPPKKLDLKEGATAIAQQRDVACALRKDGVVSCWRGGFFDAKGNPNRRFQIADTGVATALAISGELGCVIREDGRVPCWKLAGPPRAAPIPELVGAVELTTGMSSGCARTKDGKVRCFWLHEKLEKPVDVGEGRALAISDSWGGWPMVCRALPTSVSCSRPEPMSASYSIPALAPGDFPLDGGAAISQIVATNTAACSLDAKGAVRCWGFNAGAPLGRADTGFVASPLPVPGLPPIQRVATGDRFTCALAKSGKVLCWGQIMSISSRETAQPPPRPLEIPGVEGAARLVANGGYACAFSETEVATCFYARPSDFQFKPTRVPTFDSARFVRLPDLGFANAVAAVDENGQLLVGPTADFDTLKGLALTAVPGVAPAELLTIVSFGLYSSPGVYGYALSRAKSGKVILVEVGDAGAKPPKTLQGLDGALALQDNGMALLPGGKVVAARVGRPAETLFEKSPLVTLADGSEVCGTDVDGSFGCMVDGRFDVLFDEPVQVSSSGAHHCAVDAAGVVRCRGSNTAGECGVLDGLYVSEVPLAVRLE